MTAALLIENGVTLADVAKACRTSVVKLEAEARALELLIGEDWSGAPAVSAADARELRTGEARERLDHSTRWEAHRLEATAWEQARERAVAVASRLAYADVRGRGEGDPAAAAAGRDAGLLAGRAFEASTPPPTCDAAGNSAAVRRFDEPTPAPPVLRRLAGLVRGSAA
jgi:hypothetical protein